MNQTAPSPSFLYCNGWTHCFAGSKESVVRWLTNAECTAILYAEVQDGHKWVALDRFDSLDILESLKDNSLPATADDFMLPEPGDVIPEWVPESVAELCRKREMNAIRA